MIVVVAGTVEKSATVCVLYYCICHGYDEYDCCVGRYCREVCNSLCAILLYSVYVPDMKNMIVVAAGTVEKSAIVCVL